MTYRDTLVRLGEQTEKKVLAAYRKFVAGEIDHTMATELIARIIAGANGQAAAVADLGLSAQLMTQLGQEVPVGGALPQAEVERLRKAASTVLEVAADSPVPEAIVSRLARSEPLETAAKTMSDGIRKNPKVKGWTRVMEPDACQLCQWWWREGREWPAIHPMQTHKGCTCTQEIVVRRGIQETGFSRRVAAAERHAQQREERRNKK